MIPANIYIRRNGSLGASCDGTADTGHHITEDSGRFTVRSIRDMAEDDVIAENATRAEAEAAIAEDWGAAE